MPFQWHPEEDPPEIESHSKAKLNVLRSYLRAYFERLNVNPNREEFKLDLVDGFAGGGTFLSDGETISGSPLLMLEETENARKRINQGRIRPLIFNCKYYFVDINRAHTDHLRKVLKERGYPLGDAEVLIRNGRFEDEVEGIIKEIRRRQQRAGRSIFLLDQTGFSQVELGLVRRIMQELPRAEVILTFAADALINHLAETMPLIQAVSPLELTEPQIRHLIELRGQDGGRALTQRTLRLHIRTITDARFDTPFFIRPMQSRRALWFVHLSRHPTARDVMIQCHWNIQNTFEHYGPGDFGMLGWDTLRSGTLPLFHFAELEAKQMKDQLLESMPNELFSLVSEGPATVDAMRREFANRTAARFSDLDDTVVRLFRSKEFDLLDHDGKLRSRSLKHLKSTDQIDLPRKPLIPGLLSRRQL